MEQTKACWKINKTSKETVIVFSNEVAIFLVLLNVLMITNSSYFSWAFNVWRILNLMGLQNYFVSKVQ